MRRRVFLCGMGTVGFSPSFLRAQQATRPVIGFLNGSSPRGYADIVPAFRQGLNEAGYVEGQNVMIDYRWADGVYDRLPALAADLVNRQVAVIAATSTPANLVAKSVTTTIPIVFTGGDDPVRLGLVSSLSRPGGNVTGVVTLNTGLISKRLQLLHEIVRAADVVALLVNPAASPLSETQSMEARSAAHAFGLKLHVLNASNEQELNAAFAMLIEMRVGGLVVGGDPFLSSRNQQIAELSLHHKIPTIYQFHQFAAAGGLMGFGGSVKESYRLAGIYTGRILKGHRPADLPVQQVTKVEMIINLKTAKALGVVIPPSILARADEVIE
jgi:putative tryptophan/tyrosine transport system substrate-binding protein